MEDYHNNKINALLLRAAKNGNWIQVWLLLEEGVDPNATDEDGFRLIEIAMEQGNLGAIDLMIDYRASVENIPGISPFTLCEKNDCLLIRFARRDGGGIYVRRRHAPERSVDSIKNWTEARHFFEEDAYSDYDIKSLRRSIERGDIAAVEHWVELCEDVESVRRISQLIVNKKGDKLVIGFPRGDGVVVYAMQVAHMSAGRVAPVENGDEFISFEDIIYELSPLTNVKEEPPTEIPEKSNVEIGNDQIVELDPQLPVKQTRPEHRTTPARSETETLVLTQESAAEAKMKKPAKHRRARTKKWRAHKAHAEQLNFFNELGFENN